jgi:glycerophosphoryl diester phosphodiesterase
MKYIYLILSICFASCFSKLPTEPELYINSSASITLCDAAKCCMDGVYSVLKGQQEFGEEVAARWVGDRWCIYSRHDVVYSENSGKLEGDSIVLNGYVRIVRSGRGTQLSLIVLPAEGGRRLVKDSGASDIILRGQTQDNSPIILKRIRSLYDSSHNFHILAHRGGGRNSERLGISENSIEMIKYADKLGATGIEIDIKRTRDGHLILFHDDTFSPRTVKGSYLLGRVENFDLKQIKLFGQLIYGESIPTLSEALNAVINNTNLSLVWLDVKDKDIVDDVILVQQEALNKAESLGRDLLILFGIPSEDILSAYRSSIYINTTPVLVELNEAVAQSLQTCKAWAPRWTNGIPSAAVIKNMHSHGILVFTWTLDVQEYITDFLLKSNIDGILSNYPSLVAGLHYSRFSGEKLNK